MKSVLIFALLAFWAMPAFAQSVDTAWVRRYDGPGNGLDQANAIALDSFGNVYVAGASHGQGTSRDYAIVKYRPDGDTAWVRRYDGPGNYLDEAMAVVVDGSGNIVVTGGVSVQRYDSDCATIKYYPNGDTAWARRYGSEVGDEFPWDMAVDHSGNVYVTGEQGESYMTIKYYPNGDTAWVRYYTGPADPGDRENQARAIAVDDSGNVYVTGYSAGSGTNRDYATIKYHPDGDTAWVRRYDGPENSRDEAWDLAIDGSGNVYVMGWSWSPQLLYYNYVTIKYHANGDTAWVRRHDGLIYFSSFAWEVLRGIAVDGSGNVYVTGGSDFTWGGGDYVTMKYDSAGNQLWVQSYDGIEGYGDYALCLVIDACGNVYVTGNSWGNQTWTDYATVKYDPGGTELWIQRYNGPVNADEPHAMAVDDSGRVYVTGRSYGGQSDYDFATIKYVQKNQPVTFTVGVLQNPLFSAELNIYTLPSHSLRTAPTVTIGSDTLVLDGIYYDGTTIYSSGYKLISPGTVDIEVTGSDCVCSTGHHIETFAAGSILPSGGNVVSHDEVLRLEVGSGAVTKEEYFLVFKQEGQGGSQDELQSYLATERNLHLSVSRDESDQDLISPAYSITPSQFKLKSHAKLSFDYTAFDLGGKDLSKLVIHRLEGEVWTSVPSYLDSDQRQVVAFVDQLGIYRLRQAKAQDQSLMPTAYALESNYPNPFNNTTNIRYEISSPGWVKIEIHNTLGQKVRTLVHEHMPSGRYIVDWDGTNDRDQTVSSGIYFYTLKTSDFTETKKMILLK